MPTYTGLRHVHLKVADVDRSVRFYRQAVGLQLAGAKHDGRMIFLSTPGGCDLVTVSDADLGGDVDRSSRKVGDNGGIDHIGFSLADQNDLDAAIEKVLEAGGELIRRFELAPGLPSAFIRDVDGYAIQI